MKLKITNSFHHLEKTLIVQPIGDYIEISRRQYNRIFCRNDCACGNFVAITDAAGNRYWPAVIQGHYYLDRCLGEK